MRPATPPGTRPRVAVDLLAVDEQDEDRSSDDGAVPLAVRFTQALIEHAPDVEFAVLTRAASRQVAAHLEAPNARWVTVADPSPAEVLLSRLRARAVRRAARLPVVGRLGHLAATRGRRPGRQARLVAGLHADVLFCPFSASRVSHPSVPLVAAVHDLQHVSHPHLLSSGERAARAMAFETLRRRTDRLVCSDASLREVAAETLDLPRERVLALAPGRLLVGALDAPSEASIAAALARHGLHRDGFLLLVADAEARHNYPLVLTAFGMFRARRPRSELVLVCAGRADRRMASLRQTAERMGLAGHVRFVDALARAERLALVAGARAVVDASLYETLGERVIEAMALGRPVLCSRIPALSDVADAAGLTFDPHRPADLAALLERLDAQPALMHRAAELGRARVAELVAPEAVAQAYLRVLRETRAAC